MAERLLFEFDWQAAGAGVRSRELAATWATLDLAVDGEYLTIVEDLDTRSVRRSVSVSVYPLAEWVTFNWWRLLFETDKGPEARPAEGHSLREAGDGFTWPHVTFRVEGRAMRLRWRADRRPNPGWPVRYVTSGEALVSTEWVRRSFESLVEATLVRLGEAGIVDTPLHKEWAALRGLDDEEGGVRSAV